MNDRTPNIHGRLNEMLARIEPPSLQESVSELFSQLLELLDYLDLLESCLKSNETLSNSHLIFKSLYEKSRALIDTIEHQAKRADGVSATLGSLYESTVFAFEHELKRVRNFTAFNSRQPLSQLRTEFTRAHGLLRNCTQQTIISISETFDASVTGDQLFDDFKLKLEQSVVLCEALSVLIQQVNRATDLRDLDSYFALLEGMAVFESYMHFLLFRDLDEFRKFIEAVAAAKTEDQLWPLLKQFATYLDTLHSHVKMRSVLHNHPLQLVSVNA